MTYDGKQLALPGANGVADRGYIVDIQQSKIVIDDGHHRNSPTGIATETLTFQLCRLNRWHPDILAPQKVLSKRPWLNMTWATGNATSPNCRKQLHANEQ